MTDVVELTLSQAVNITDTNAIRSRVAARCESAGPMVELVHFNVFVLCTAGTGSHMVDFVEHDMAPGVALWIRPGQVQKWSLTSEFDATVVVFESAVVPDLPLFERTAAATAVVHLSDDEPMRDQMAWLARDLADTGDTAGAATVIGLLLRLFARAVEATGPAAPASERHVLAERFIASIDANLEQRSVGWHARHIGASSRSLGRATAEVLGRAPKEVIDAAVMLEAQRRLAWSTSDIATIARGLHFSDPSNFGTFFRARSGMTPSAFRAGVWEIDSLRSPADPNG